MDITFLIGNGFDLNIGLKTKYSDFYKYYIKKEPTDPIATGIKEQYDLWADLEFALGQFTKEIPAERIESFFDSKEKLEYHLIAYLKRQRDRVIYKEVSTIVSHFQKNVTSFYKEFNTLEQTIFLNLFNQSSGVHYHFVSFNYTDVLDRIIQLCIDNLAPFTKRTYAKGTAQDTIDLPLHVHGTLNQELVLGVNDPSQIDNETIKANNRYKNYFIKTAINDVSGNNVIPRIQKILEESTYICLFGLSIGETDNFWWQYIISWLLKNSAHRLILYVKDDTVVSASAAAGNRFADKHRDVLFKHNNKLNQEQQDKIYNQVIVIQNTNIFDIQGIELQSEETEENDNG